MDECADENKVKFPSREECYMVVAKTANSNQDLTNLYIKKVVFPGNDVPDFPGTEVPDDLTCDHRVGLLWDDFRGHHAKVVKDFTLSDPIKEFFIVLIIPGGLTPLTQPLDKVINKVFKGYFRDLYDQYIVTAEIKNGAPVAPSRQLLATMIVTAWRDIKPELVRKAWTACGYPEQDKLHCENEDAVALAGEVDVGDEVERICGFDTRANFEDTACDADPHFPEDWSDDEVEEVYNEDDDLTPSANEPAPVPAPVPTAAGVGCAAGHLCGMKGISLFCSEGNISHRCLNCDNPMHGVLCGALWEERGSICTMSYGSLTEEGKRQTKSIGALICAMCMKG